MERILNLVSCSKDAAVKVVFELKQRFDLEVRLSDEALLLDKSGKKQVIKHLNFEKPWLRP